MASSKLLQLGNTQDEDYVDLDSEASLSSDGSFAGKIKEDDDIDSDISLTGKECTYKDMDACNETEGAKGPVINCSKKVVETFITMPVFFNTVKTQKLQLSYKAGHKNSYFDPEEDYEKNRSMVV
eukprot:14894237-Ditylum_brightwellii.AAC.1